MLITEPLSALNWQRNKKLVMISQLSSLFIEKLKRIRNIIFHCFFSNNNLVNFSFSNNTIFSLSRDCSPITKVGAVQRPSLCILNALGLVFQRFLESAHNQMHTLLNFNYLKTECILLQKWRVRRNM